MAKHLLTLDYVRLSISDACSRRRTVAKRVRLAEAHADEIDLLLTDVTMAVLDGRELAERLPPRVSGREGPSMSGHPEPVIAHEGVLDPGVAYVAKPFTPEQISSRVRDILAGA